MVSGEQRTKIKKATLFVHLEMCWNDSSPYLEHSSCDVLLTIVTPDTKLGVIVRLAVWNPIPREEQQMLLFVSLYFTRTVWI